MPTTRVCLRHQRVRATTASRGPPVLGGIRDSTAPRARSTGGRNLLRGSGRRVWTRDRNAPSTEAGIHNAVFRGPIATVEHRTPRSRSRSSMPRSPPRRACQCRCGHVGQPSSPRSATRTRAPPRARTRRRSTGATAPTSAGTVMAETAASSSTAATRTPAPGRIRSRSRSPRSPPTWGDATVTDSATITATPCHGADGRAVGQPRPAPASRARRIRTACRRRPCSSTASTRSTRAVAPSSTRTRRRRRPWARTSRATT